MRSDTASRAVNIRIGVRSPAPRSRRQTSSPSTSGMPTSSTTASGLDDDSRVSACLPSSAASTSYPPSVSARRSASRTERSSSTTNIRTTPMMPTGVHAAADWHGLLRNAYDALGIGLRALPSLRVMSSDRQGARKRVKAITAVAAAGAAALTAGLAFGASRDSAAITKAAAPAAAPQQQDVDPQQSVPQQQSPQSYGFEPPSSSSGGSPSGTPGGS